MLEAIKSICEWNEIAWNKWKYNRHLETSMLSEEFSEAIIALKENDDIEAIDGILDVFWVWVWTLYKKWLTPEQINNCFEEIKSSNFSKFIIDDKGNKKVLKDETWKILKPITHFKPNLEQFLK
jgi:hypothetical protein